MTTAPLAIRTAFRLSLTVAVIGAAAVSVATLYSTSHGARTALAAVLVPVGVILLMIVAAIALVILLRPKRTVQQALLVVASSDTLLGLSASRPSLALAGAIGASLLLTARSLWYELSDIRASRLGRWLLVVAAALLFSLIVLARPQGIVIGAAVLLLLAALAAGLGGLLLLARNAPLPNDRGPLEAIYNANADASISAFLLMQDKRYFWNRSRTAVLGYASRAGAAVVLGPGIGPRDQLPPLYRDFRNEAHRRGWRLSFYQVPPAMADALGWGVRYRIGDEAIIDLVSLTLDGPRIAKVRHEVSRGRRNGVQITILRDDEVRDDDRRAMRVLTTMGVEHRHLGEMGFSIGRRDDAPAVQTTVALAHNTSGELVAYATWLWLPAASGIALDAMRRRADAPGGTMELLLYTSMQLFKSDVSWASLGLAPAGGPSATNLTAFKAKFLPRWEPRYMVAERVIDWPIDTLATLLLHYPRLAPHLPKLPHRRPQWRAA